MSLLSEKLSKVPHIHSPDLHCHDTFDTIETLESLTLDSEMQTHIWTPQDKDFISTTLTNDFTANPYYLQSKQPFLTNSMRSLLIDWIIEISSEFYLKRETCYKAISLVDKYLSESSCIKKDHLQLIGLSSLFISAKYEEISYPKITDFIKAAGGIYICQDMKNMEKKILIALQWKIPQANSMSICNWLMTQWDCFIIETLGNKGQTVTFKDMRGYRRYREAVQLLDSCCLDIGVLRFKNRIIAACVCYLVLFKHFKEQKYAMLIDGGVYRLEFEVEYARMFMELFLNFCSAALEIYNYDELYMCGEYLISFFDIQVSYELPCVCKTGVRADENYQAFLDYQTYNPACLEAVQMKINNNF